MKIDKIGILTGQISDTFVHNISNIRKWSLKSSSTFSKKLKNISAYNVLYLT